MLLAGAGRGGEGRRLEVTRCRAENSPGRRFCGECRRIHHGPQIHWYRGAGGAGPIVLRLNPGEVDTADPAGLLARIAPAAIDDLARAAAAGVDEVHWDLTLAGLDPQRQVKVLEALAAQVKF